VNFIAGRKAILTIFNDGKEVEKVTMSDYNDTAKLHQLFAQKGFSQYSASEVAARRKMKEAESAQAASSQANSGLRGTLAQRFMNKKAGAGKSDAHLSTKGRKRLMKDKLRQLKEARENYMVVGAPRG